MRYLLMATFFFISGWTSAQDFDRFFTVSWDINVPATSTSWIDGTSLSGAKFGYRGMVSDRIAAGFDVSWAVYNKYYPPDTFTSPDGAITTDYFNYIYSYGFMASGQYFLPSSNPKIMPYAGIGLGAALNRFAQYYNIYTDADDSWGFVARPEVGVLLPFGSKVGVTAAVHYDYTTAGSDTFNYSGFNHYGFSIGLALMTY